ncbi:hypothetical protein D3C81_1914930 [compost metagenome]
MRWQWQVGAELAAKTRLRTDAQSALHGVAQVEGQGQPQPGAAELPGNAGASLGKGLEDLDLGILGDADTGVADFDPDAILPCTEAHIDPAETSEFEGVG